MESARRAGDMWGARFGVRLALLLYWLLFAKCAMDRAHNPGLVLDRENVPYPWRGVFTTVDILALEVLFLGWIFMPRAHGRFWARLCAGVAVFAVLTAFSVVTYGTDHPGHSYVPGYFHVLTFMGLLAVAAFVAGSVALDWLWRR
jgi:hypothetical protein